MNMDDLMEQLDEVLDSGFKMPGKRVVVDVEKVRAIIDDMRMTMPTEIKQAKGIVADRADIINDAKREADSVIRLAEERAKAMVAQEEITKLAQAKAGEVLAAAQKKSRDSEHGKCGQDSDPPGCGLPVRRCLRSGRPGKEGRTVHLPVLPPQHGCNRRPGKHQGRS